MPAIRGLTVSVGDWYASLLAVTLPRNMRHLTTCHVVTAPGDPAIEVVRSVPGAHAIVTDAFTRFGARFNKGLAIEEAFDAMGRRGWLAIWDADIVWPESMPWASLRPDALHGLRRRICENVDAWRPDLNWRHCQLRHDAGPIGFTQVFHADSPWLAGKRPWYDVSFAHAGGGDAAFMAHWPRRLWLTLPAECLHMGPVDRHWFGTDSEGRDLMDAFVTRNGWRRAMTQADPSAVDRVGAITERVAVPGYEPSTYELPFVRRAREASGGGRACG